MTVYGSLIEEAATMTSKQLSQRGKINELHLKGGLDQCNWVALWVSQNPIGYLKRTVPILSLDS